MMLAFVGLSVISFILGAGVFYILTNVTLRRAPDRYTYTTDADGNDVVKDNSDE